MLGRTTRFIDALFDPAWLEIQDKTICDVATPQIQKTAQVALEMSARSIFSALPESACDCAILAAALLLKR